MQGNGRSTISSLPHSPIPSSRRGYGWSLKRLIRSLVLSETFRQSSRPASVFGVRRSGFGPNPERRTPNAIDPENRRLHHFPARRLEAEAIRDSILAVSGRLDRKLFGPSIQPHRFEPMPERRLFPGPLDGNGRRSVYTRITLMQGPAFLEVFNFPDPKVAQGRRDVTNVPAQALTLLNDPFVTDQARVWAERLVSERDASVAARLDRMFRRALARPPRPEELSRFEAAVAEFAALHNVPEAELLRHRDVWKEVAHAVFNLKEFIYLP